MPTGKLDLTVLAAVNVQDPGLQGNYCLRYLNEDYAKLHIIASFKFKPVVTGGPGVFFVTHVGGERYRSSNKHIRGSDIVYEEEQNFVIPEELENVDFQIWVDQGYDQQLFGESRLVLNEVQSGRPFQDLPIYASNGYQLGALKIKTHFTQGDMEEFDVDLDEEPHVASRSLDGVPEHGTRGLGNINFENILQLFNTNQGQGADTSRGLFGNKQQQYSKPPPIQGYQGPGQSPGQKKSQVSNILFGVGAGVAALGVGAIAFGLFYKYGRKGPKKDHKNKSGKSDQTSNLPQQDIQTLEQTYGKIANYDGTLPQQNTATAPNQLQFQSQAQEYTPHGYPVLNSSGISDKDDYTGQQPVIPGGVPSLAKGEQDVLGNTQAGPHGQVQRELGTSGAQTQYGNQGGTLPGV